MRFRSESLKLFWKSWPLCRLVLAEKAKSSVMVFKKGHPSFSSPLYRGSFCAAETMLDSSCKRGNPLLPREGSCIRPSTVRILSGFYSDNPVQGRSHPVASEIDLEYLETFG